MSSIEKSNSNVKKKITKSQNEGDKKAPNIKKINKSAKRIRVSKNNIDNLTNAMNAIGNGLSIKEASDHFNISRSTLHAKFHNYTSLECKVGAPRVLNKNEEDEIVKWVVYCTDRGFTVTKNTLLDCVQQFIIQNKKKNPFKDNRPGYYWYKNFIKRHDCLSQKIAQNLTPTNILVTEAEIRQWFAKVEEHLGKKQLLYINPKRIFNLEESTFMLVPNDNSVIAKKVSKSAYKIIEGNERASPVVLFAVAASGVRLAPMILVDAKNKPKNNISNEMPDDWATEHSHQRFMTSEMFFSYITNVFFKWLKDNNYEFPVVLYVAGHSSHFTFSVVQFCQANGIELVALYPNSRHILQPLDVAVFHILKNAYKKVFTNWRKENNITHVKKFMFAPIFKLTLDSIDLSKIIKNGFRATGLYPFDADAVPYDIINTEINYHLNSTCSVTNNSNKNSKFVELLHDFEKNVLSPEILQGFKTNESNSSWCDGSANKGLFIFWKKLKKLCDCSLTENCSNSIEFHDNISKLIKKEKT